MSEKGDEKIIYQWHLDIFRWNYFSLIPDSQLKNILYSTDKWKLNVLIKHFLNNLCESKTHSLNLLAHCFPRVWKKLSKRTYGTTSQFKINKSYKQSTYIHHLLTGSHVHSLKISINLYFFKKGTSNLTIIYLC